MAVLSGLQQIPEDPHLTTEQNVPGHRGRGSALIRNLIPKDKEIWSSSAASQLSIIDLGVQLQSRLEPLRSQSSKRGEPGSEQRLPVWGSQSREGTKAAPLWVHHDLSVIAYRQNLPPPVTPGSFGICDQVSSNFF